MILSTTSTLCAAEVSLTTDTSIATEGYFVLAWSVTADLQQSTQSLLLQQSAFPGFDSPRQFEVPTSGQLTLSGLGDGRYYFRIGPLQPALDGASVLTSTAWSDPLEVVVAHHSLQRALGFFTTGLILFVILLGTIVWGSRHTREHPARERDTHSVSSPGEQREKREGDTHSEERRGHPLSRRKGHPL